MTSHCVELARARPLLGTLVELRAIASTPTVARSAIDLGFAAVARVHALMSFHEADSDLSRIHARAWREPVRVHRSTWRVLRFAQQLAAATDGLFDVTTAAALVRAGRLPAPPCQSPSPATDASWRDIRLLPGDFVVLHRPLLLDLGGIAKGFAVDRAMAAMYRAGALGSVVDAGGDLRIRSSEPRRVAVRDPASPGLVRPIVEVWDGAVATSSAYPDDTGGAPWSGIVHPGTGMSVDPGRSVTVLARTALRADALTKVLALAPQTCPPLFVRLGAAAIVLDADGEARHLDHEARGWRILGGVPR